MPETITFLQEGRTLAPEKAQKASVILYDADDPDVAQVFTSAAGLRAWSEKSRHAERLARVEDLARRAKKYKDNDNDAAMKRQASVTKRLTSELKKLSSSTGLPVESMELFRKATVDFDPLMGPVFDPAIIHQHINGGGRLLPFDPGISCPNLGWLGFDNIASSVTWMGVVSLWAGYWFGGARLLLTSAIPTRVNLTAFGFNDVASSLILY